MRRLWIIPALVLSISISVLPALAQDDEAAERPKIGLVLGGGGARGAAHVGVLRALDEMNIPIDYVAGTSMGSVVGALFAIGLNPGDVESTLMAVDWDDLFNDRPVRQDRVFRRKQDDSVAFLPVEWGWNGRIVLSSGMIAGQKLSFAFRDNNLYLAGYNGFDNLAYPFRAVATDLQTGKMFVPDRGSLLKIVRASMSIPGVFPPVTWESRTLVDGYLARNLPVDVCREMGADIIIAVDVGSLPEETSPDHFKTIGGVNMQKGIIDGRQNVDPQLEDAEIIIRPILTGISSRDFKKVGLAIEPGYEAALAVARQLEKLAVAPEQYARHLANHAYPGQNDLVISDIKLINNTRVHDQAFLKNIRQEVGKPLELDELKYDLAQIYDFGVFELVDFHLDIFDDEITLVITAKEKYYSPNILNFGFSYYGGEGNQSILNARARWNRLEMNRYGAEQRTDMQVGQSMFFRTEFYQPLSWNRVPFFSVYGEFGSRIHPWYYELKHWGDYKTQFITLKPNLGMRLGKWGELRVGVEIGHMRASDRTGLSLAEFNGPRGGYKAMLRVDHQDVPFLPHHGHQGAVRYFLGRPEFGSDLDYQKLEFTASMARSYKRNTFHLSLSGGSSLGTELPEFDMFTLGGFNRLMGYRKDQLRGQEFALGQARYYYELKDQSDPFSTGMHVFLSFEAGNAWYLSDDTSFDSLHYSGSFGFVATTVLGPLTLAYGRADDGNDSGYLTLGAFKEYME